MYSKQISFTVGGGNGTVLPIAGDREGFSLPVFSYDALSILGGLSDAGPLGPGSNGPTADSMNMTIPLFNMTAAGLGNVDQSGAARMGGTGCLNTIWLSDTAVGALAAAQSSGRFLSLVVTLGMGKGSFSNLYSFNKPTVANASLVLAAGSPVPNRTSVTNAPPGGKMIRDPIAITGAGFGAVTSSSAVRAGGSACVSTAWASSTAVIARLPNAVLGSLALVATVALNFGTQADGLQIDAPSVSTITNKVILCFLYLQYPFFSIC